MIAGSLKADQVKREAVLLVHSMYIEFLSNIEIGDSITVRAVYQLVGLTDLSK